MWLFCLLSPATLSGLICLLPVILQRGIKRREEGSQDRSMKRAHGQTRAEPSGVVYFKKEKGEGCDFWSCRDTFIPQLKTVHHWGTTSMRTDRETRGRSEGTLFLILWSASVCTEVSTISVHAGPHSAPSLHLPVRGGPSVF